LLLVSRALAQDDKELAKDPLQLAHEAFRATAENLRSGIGTGTFEYYEQKGNQDKPTLMTRAKLQVYFDRPKYHVRLEHEKDLRYKLDKRIIIYDKTAILTSAFSKGHHPTGAQTYVYQADEQNTTPTSAQFPWDPSRLGHHLRDFDWLIKNVPRDSIKFEKLPKGGYRGTYSKHGATVTFDVLPEYGFHVSRVKTSSQEYHATWKQAGEIWFIDSFVDQWDLRRRGQPLSHALDSEIRQL
jgi:hypothetical protein